MVNALLTVLASAGVAAAVPFNLANGASSGRFSLPVVRREATAKNPWVSIYKTYRKYGAAVPETLRQRVFSATNGRLGKRTEGSVVNYPSDEYDDSYLLPVEIGTPAQTLYLDLDTGSSDLWVFSTELPSSEDDGQIEYNPSKSSTAKVKSGYTWDIEYADGSGASGNVYTDVVSIGGVSVSSQAVELAEKVSSEFYEDSTTDGLVGFGFDNINTVSPQAQETWFDNAKSSLDSPVFTADLKYHANGTYDFGYIDTTKYTGTIAYSSVSSSEGYWTFTSSGYAVNGGSFVSSSISGIADTGTTLLYLPTSIAKAYYAAVSGSSTEDGYYVFSCSATLPTFTYGVGTGRIVIPGEYINYGPIEDGSSTCIGGLQSSSGLGLNIFGDVALKAAFVVFNKASSPTIGFATKTLD